MFVRTALLVLKKDVAIELRSYEILSTTLFFAVACVAIFSFAFVKEGQAAEDAAAGILWIAIAFSGTLALGRTFERERYGETLKALLLAPARRHASQGADPSETESFHALSDPAYPWHLQGTGAVCHRPCG